MLFDKVFDTDDKIDKVDSHILVEYRRVLIFSGNIKTTECWFLLILSAEDSL